MRVYDYTCELCGDTREAFVKDDTVTTVACECGGVAHRQIAAPRFKLPGYDPAYPTAWDKWGREAEKRHRKADKVARENGEL